MTIGQRSTLGRVLAEVCRVGDISHEVLCGFSRPQHVADCRHAAMYCLRRYVDLTVKDAGRVFARDHTTITHGANRVAGVIDKPNCPVVIQEIVDNVRLELGIVRDKDLSGERGLV